MPDAGWRQEAASAAGAIARRHGWRLVLLFAGLLLPVWGFLELADEVHEGEPIPFDLPMLQFAQAIASPGLDRFFVVVTELGYGWGVVPGDVLLVLVLLARRRWRQAAFAAIATGGSGLLNVATKQLFARARPDLWESIAPLSTYSFPSGHAMGSMTLGLVLVLLAWPTRARWWVAAAMAVFVPLVGLSRVYLGVHYPSDILAGWAAASIWVVGTWLVLMRGGRGRASPSVTRPG